MRIGYSLLFSGRCLVPHLTVPHVNIRCLSPRQDRLLIHVSCGTSRAFLSNMNISLLGCCTGVLTRNGLSTTVYSRGCPAITCVDWVGRVVYVTSTAIGPAYARPEGDTVGNAPPLYPRVTKGSTFLIMPLRGIASTRRGHETTIVLLEEDQDMASMIVS